MILQTLLFFILVNIIFNNVLSISGKEVPIFRKDYTYNEKYSSFYKLHKVSNTWVQAKFKCQQEGAVLFYPETKDEAVYVSTTFYKNGQEWIGISDLLADKQFETVTGVSAESVYCDWEANTWNQNDQQQQQYQPWDNRMIKNNEERHCVVLSYNRKMEIANCNTNRPFLCKKTLNSIVWNNDCKIADSKYVYNSEFGKCYKFHLRPMDWMTAHTTCIAEQSHLAIINSQEEANFLVNMTTEAPKNRYRGFHLAGVVHLGFHNLFRDGYTTVKGYPLIESGYTNWGYNQPDNAGEDEELCGSMFYGGELNDIHCTDICYFICEHDVDDNTDLDIRSTVNQDTPKVSTDYLDNTTPT